MSFVYFGLSWTLVLKFYNVSHGTWPISFLILLVLTGEFLYKDIAILCHFIFGTPGQSRVGFDKIPPLVFE